MDDFCCIDAPKAVDRHLWVAILCLFLIEHSSGLFHARDERRGKWICLVVLHYAKRLEQFLLELRFYSKELDKGLFVVLLSSVKFENKTEEMQSVGCSESIKKQNKTTRFVL
jgi:hypothetical protein